MAVTAGLCICAKLDFLTGVHEKTDKYKIALYSPAAQLTPFCEEYSKQDEVVGQGYVAGGMELQGYSAYCEGIEACIEWTKETLWKNASITARGAVIYNASKGNRAILVMDVTDVHGNPVTSTNGNFKLDAGIAVKIG